MLPKTLASRHQYNCALMQGQKELCRSTISLLNPKTMQVEDLSNLLRDTLRGLAVDVNDGIVLGTGLILDSHKYQRNCVFVLQCVDGTLQFVEPRHGLQHNGQYMWPKNSQQLDLCHITTVSRLLGKPVWLF